MYLAQGHNAVTPVRFEPAAPWSQVMHSTTEQLRSPTFVLKKECHMLPQILIGPLVQEYLQKQLQEALSPTGPVTSGPSEILEVPSCTSAVAWQLSAGFLQSQLCRELWLLVVLGLQYNSISELMSTVNKCKAKFESTFQGLLKAGLFPAILGKCPWPKLGKND